MEVSVANGVLETTTQPHLSTMTLLKLLHISQDCIRVLTRTSAGFVEREVHLPSGTVEMARSTGVLTAVIPGLNYLDHTSLEKQIRDYQPRCLELELVSYNGAVFQVQFTMEGGKWCHSICQTSQLEQLIQDHIDDPRVEHLFQLHRLLVPGAVWESDRCTISASEWPTIHFPADDLDQLMADMHRVIVKGEAVFSINPRENQLTLVSGQLTWRWDMTIAQALSGNGPNHSWSYRDGILRCQARLADTPIQFILDASTLTPTRSRFEGGLEAMQKRTGGRCWCLRLRDDMQLYMCNGGVSVRLSGGLDRLVRMYDMSEGEQLRLDGLVLEMRCGMLYGTLFTCLGTGVVQIALPGDLSEFNVSQK